MLILVLDFESEYVQINWNFQWLQISSLGLNSVTFRNHQMFEILTPLVVMNFPCNECYYC